MIKDILLKIKETFKLFLQYNPFGFSFENIGYVPRWLVLWFDIQIIGIVLIIAEFIISDFNYFSLTTFFTPKFLIAIFVTFVFFLVLKKYVWLIRNSS